MKILFKKSEEISLFSRFGIEECFVKEIFYNEEPSKSVKRLHYHTAYEIHMITDGCQEYEVNEENKKVEAGEFLLITPSTKHKLIYTKKGTHKFSILFSTGENFDKKILKDFESIVRKTDKNFVDNIEFLLKELKNHKELSSILIENRIFETIVCFLRIAGLKEDTVQRGSCYEDYRLSMVKQYIEDNIEQALTVGELSRYCHLSQKQLTRIFYEYDGIPPSEYLLKRKNEHIKKLLDEGLSIKEISEKMHFTNEYYFNTYFKKCFGMPPGRYRKMNDGRE